MIELKEIMPLVTGTGGAVCLFLALVGYFKGWWLSRSEHNEKMKMLVDAHAVIVGLHQKNEAEWKADAMADRAKTENAISVLKAALDHLNGAGGHQ